MILILPKQEGDKTLEALTTGKAALAGAYRHSR